MNKTSELIPFATQQWLDAFRETLNTSQRFRKNAASWNDDAMYIIDTDTACGWDRPVAFYMKWKNGEVVIADVIDDVDRSAVFRVTGSYSSWAQAYHSRMDAGVAFLTGRFRFRGPFAKAARHIAGETIMIETAFEVPHPVRAEKGRRSCPRLTPRSPMGTRTG